MRFEMKKVFLFFVALGFFAASCAKLELAKPEGVTITVSSEGEVKTSLSNGNVLWSPSDKIRVFSDTDNTGEEYVLIEGAGTGNGSFFGNDMSGSTYYVAYPSTASFNGSSFTYTMPAEQPYTQGSFARNANPMLSSASASLNGFSMKNLCGVLKLRLTGTEHVSRLELTFSSAVSGTGTVNAGGNTLVMDGGASNTVAMTFDTPLTLDSSIPSDFWFVIPAGSYTYMDVKLINEDSQSCTKSLTSSFSITRSAQTTMETRMPAIPKVTRPQLTFWSLNIACQSNDKNSSWSSDNYWTKRRPGVYAFFNGRSPDIIGTQECEYRQRVNILDNTSGYAAYGLGKEYGQESSGSSGFWWNKKDYNTDSSNAIFYKTSKFEIVSKGTFWLSDNPSKVGSADGINCAWIKFRWIENGYQFYVFNTHLQAHYDPEDYKARAAQSKVLYNQVTAINTEELPMIIMGDFNCSASDMYNDNDPRTANWFWARNQDGKTDKNTYPTSYNGFVTTYDAANKVTTSPKSNIDHIAYKYFHVSAGNKNGMVTGSFETETSTWAGVQYISDHWPICARFVFDFQ
jgi:endonuclease/exonuclease/phosphatase family metal-dependent hydrolase